MPNLPLSFSPLDPRLHSRVGTKTAGGIVVDSCDSGTALYGPYATLEPGNYLACVAFDQSARLTGSVVMEVYCAETGVAASVPLDLPAGLAGGQRAELEFSLARKVSTLEIRLLCTEQVCATITAVELRKPPARARKSEIEELREQVARLEGRLTRLHESRYIPQLLAPTVPATAPFMAHSTCSAADFVHPRYHELIGLMKRAPRWHRKQWEYAFIMHHLLQSGLVKAGSRGLVFGVGRERLPALFAGMGADIVATDAPREHAHRANWARSGEYASGLAAIRHLELVDAAVFDARVSYQPCDMNDIAPNLTGFDFNWSSCCFEHLGTLEAGLQFVLNAVEKTLRVGGLAVHTTEFNLTSDTRTVARGATVLYRRCDLEALVARLRAHGHAVQPFSVAPDAHFCDAFVDVPPFSNDVHLKALIQSYVCTSAGIVVRRGR